MESQSAVTAIGQPQAQVQTAAATAAEEKAAYDQAFQALKELRYADAAEDFQSFLDAYPSSDGQCAILAGGVVLRDTQLRYRTEGIPGPDGSLS